MQTALRFARRLALALSRFAAASVVTTVVTTVVGGALAAAAPCAQEAEAAEPALPVGGGTLPVQVVAGRLVVTCDPSTPANRIPANLFIEYEGRHGLQLHNRAAAALRAESPDGTPRPITLHFPDFTLTVPKRELGDEDLFEEFTKYHSAEMGENALIGSIGVEVLDDWKVTFDVANGRLVLAPLGTISGAGDAPPTTARIEVDGTVVAPLSLLDGMVWLPVRWNEGAPGGLMLGTALYDTRVDARAARSLGKPAGDVGPIRVGNIDLHRYVAFRPEPIVQVHPDGVVGVTGINLLEHLRVEVDRGRRELRVAESRPAAFPTADLEFFRARAAEDTGAVVAFLDAHGAEDPHGSGRLAHEAARLLLEYRLEDGCTREEVTAAVTWMHRTIAPDLGTTRMLDLMKEMADAGEDDVVIAAGKLGIDSGRKDRYPNAVHEVHGRLGRTLLDQALAAGPDEAPALATDAWRHLLSAAFGLPEDGRINLDLGRFYEHQGRYRRAFSRYIQAVIRPESGPEAVAALQRVQPLVSAEERSAGEDASDAAFSVDTIEKMIAGKVRNFGASSRFVPSEDQPARRTVLCEFFTNGHLGDETNGGAIGGALGFEGLVSHFEPAQVVFLEHHLPVPQPDALCNSFARERAATFKIEKPTVILIDGQKGSPGAGKWRDAEEIYNRARKVVLGQLATHAEHEVSVTATIEDGRVSGVASVVGPEDDGFVVHVVLAEARVLYPGSSGIIVHRQVSRGSLLYDEAGVPYAPTDFVEDIAFSRDLAAFETDQLAFLADLEGEGLGSVPRISTRIDPREARVVAFLCDSRTGAVLAAGGCTPTLVTTEAPEPAQPAASAPLPREGSGK
ncbi:MAG: hypothetical protein R3F49_03020 [Planctomycetota bacterium]